MAAILLGPAHTDIAATAALTRKVRVETAPGITVRCDQTRGKLVGQELSDLLAKPVHFRREVDWIKTKRMHSEMLPEENAG